VVKINPFFKKQNSLVVKERLVEGTNHQSQQQGSSRDWAACFRATCF